jgi:hypothetical protein
MQHRLLLSYYAGTVIFLVLDWFFGVNIRIAFLDDSAGWRAAYYVLCGACFLGILRWPHLERIIGGFESTITLAALIINMALRAMLPAGPGFDQPMAPITMAEIANFLIAGFFAYVSFWRGMRDLQGRM